MRFAKYFSLIGLALFAYILYAVGPFELLASLAKLNPLLLLAALLSAIPVVVLKAIKQNILMKPFNAKISVAEGSRIWLIGYFLSIITPGRSGDFLRAVYLSKETGASKGKCLTAVAVERVLDLGYLFLTGLAGMAILSHYFGMESSAITLVAALFVIFVLVVLALTKKRIVVFFAGPLFRFFTPARFKERFRTGFHEFYAGLAVYRREKRVMTYSIALTIVSWFAIMVEYYLIALALNLPLSYQFLLVIMPVIILVEALPISFSGIGTRDATAIFLLSLKGVVATDAVSFSLAILALSVFLAILGFIFFQKKKIEI